MLTELPWVAIFIAVIANMLFGMLWYSPLLFSKAWVAAHKFKQEELCCTPRHIFGAFIVSLVTAAVLAGLCQYFNISTIKQAACTGFFLWLGLIATSHFSGVIWARKPLQVYFIDTASLLISVVFMMIFFTYWKSLF